MGLIRKTLSISTLGLVSWKGKKERLAETEQALARARAELDVTSKRSKALEEHLSTTRSQLDDVELSALRDARKARRKGLWQGRLERRKQAAAAQAVEEQAAKLRDRAGKRAHELRTSAERRADEIRYRATGTSKRFSTPLRVFGRKASSKARSRADELRDAAAHASESARQAVAERTRH